MKVKLKSEKSTDISISANNFYDLLSVISLAREDLFVNSKISMQHSNYRTTSKHYIDKREVAKQMAKNGFRIFDKKNKKCTPVVHSRHKKRATSL